MNEELKDRIVLPIGVPLAAIVLIEIVAIATSRVLLTAGRTGAVVVALVLSLGVLGGAAVIAARPRLRSSSILALCVVALVALVGVGAVAAMRGPAPLEHGGEQHGGAKPDEHGREPADHAGAVHLTARALRFSTEELELPAGETVELEFVNNDSAPHNVSIFPDEEATDPLFEGDIINGGERITYEVEPLEAGTYYFHCDVHPAMNGSVTVEE